MQAIGLDGLAVDAIILAVIVALQHKALVDGVAQFRLAQFLKFPATGHGIHLHLILKGVGAGLDLGGHLGALPLEPIRHVGELGLATQGGQGAVLV